MASSLGSLVVTLGLDAATFTEGLSKAEYQSKKWRDQIERDAAKVGAALGVAVVAAAAGLAALTKGAIDSADQVSKLSQQVGISSESFSGLQYAFELGGVAGAEFAGSMVKLDKSISEAAKGTKEQADAFRVLGVEVKNADGSLRDADAVLGDVATKFAGYADGAEKSALAVALFGRSGAALIPTLNSGAAGIAGLTDEAQRFGLVIDAQTGRAAEEFNDTLTKIGKVSDALGLRPAQDLLPTLQGVASELLNAATGTGPLSGGLDLVASAASAAVQALLVLGANVAYVFKGVGREIGAVAAQAVALANLDLGAFRAISDAVKEDAQRARAELDAFERRVLSIGSVRPAFAAQLGDPAAFLKQNTTKPAAPRLPSLAKSSGADKASNDAAKELRRQLDGELKVIRAFADEQRDAYTFANQYVKAAYDDGRIDLAQHFQIERQIRAAALDATVAAFDKEIAATEAYAAKANKPEARLDAENRIAEAAVKRSQAVQKAQQDGVLAAIEEERAIAQLQGRYDDLRATILQLSGDSQGASQIRIGQQVAEARKLLTQSGQDTGTADRLGELLGLTEHLNTAQRDYSLLVERSRDAEQSIVLAARGSGATEIETLRAIGAERAGALVQLQVMTDKARELAAVLGTDDARRFAADLASQLRLATAAVDPLLDKIKDLAGEASHAFSSAFIGAVKDGNSLRDVLKGIGDDLLDIANRELISKPLEGFFKNFVGDLSKGASGGAGTAASGSGGGFWSSIASAIGGFFGGGKAGGGPVNAGTMYRVAENRPEMLDVAGKQFLLMGNQRGRIDPNPRLGGGARTLNAPIHITVPGNTDQRTAGQIGAEVARRLAVASSRMN